MTSSHLYLFNGHSAEMETKAHLDSIERRINEQVDLEELEAKTSGFLAAAQIKTCEIHRDQAQFHVGDEGNVRLVLPLSGNTNLLTHGAEADEGYGPYVELDEGFWDDRDPWLALSAAFPTGTPPSEIRDWAKAEVDDVENRLRNVQKVIDVFNATAESKVAVFIADRTRHLEETAALRAGLSTPGI